MKLERPLLPSCTLCLLAVALLAPVALDCRAAPAPYIEDADTLRLWHFDEPNNPHTEVPVFYTQEESLVSWFDLLVANGAKLEAPSFSTGLQGALDTRGIPGVDPLTAGALSEEDAFYLSDVVGSDGAFTYEGLLYLDFDPTTNLADRTAVMNIISLENESNPRTFQFRMLPPNHGENPFTNDTQWVVDFLNINLPGSGVGTVEQFQALLPIAGDDAAQQGAWYHLATTYDGAENTADNLKFFWTELSRGPAMATELASFQMINDLGSAHGIDYLNDFAVGNEGRSASGDNFVGLIDEVRVSDTARAANAFNLDGTPYAIDGNTKLLYHFDELNPEDFPDSLVNTAFDEVLANAVDLDVRDDGELGAPAFSVDFGTALNTFSNNAAGAFAPLHTPLANFVDAATGAFTFEALVRVDFDPATETNLVMQLVTMDREGAVDGRPWQWRMEAPVSENNPGTAGDPMMMVFIKIAGGVQFLTTPLPASGIHAPVQGRWYHAAVTYDGNEGAPGNMTFYWTALDSGVTEAVAAGTVDMAADLAGADGNFSVANENRSHGQTGATDNWHGLIDEVRISSIAREPGDFVFAVKRPALTAISVNPDTGTVGLTWTSEAGASYTIRRTSALGTTWDLVESGIAGADSETSRTVSSTLPEIEAYQVEKE